jgi:hypothetical protein
VKSKIPIPLSKIRVSRNFMEAAQVAYGHLDLVTPKPQIALPGRKRVAKTQ